MPTVERDVPALNILSLDDEFLIALDAQFVLSDRAWCQVVPAVTHTLEKHLTETNSSFDIVLLDPQSPGLDIDIALAKCAAHGACLIFSTVEPDTQIAAHPTVPQVSKPYAEMKLLRAIAAALTPVQPEIARSVIAEIDGSGP